MKKVILLILLMCCPVLVFGEICDRELEINTNCTMLTPTLRCTVYNYTIYSSNGSFMETNVLGLLNSTIYYFNFTLEEGEYIVELCDGSTREVKVKDEDETKMILGVIILLPLIMGFLLLYAGNQLGGRHIPIKVLMFLLAPISFWVSLHYGMVSLVKYYNFPELQNLIGSTVYWTGGVFILLFVYWLIYLFVVMVNYSAQKKKEKLEY